MKDKKFIIALAIIVILALLLVYIVFIGPRLQGYLVQKQVDAQQDVVKTIIQIVNQQGYVVLNNENSSVVLIDRARLPTPPQTEIQQQNPTTQPTTKTK